MPLDETILPGQAGHIADHEAIAETVNDLAGTISTAVIAEATARAAADTAEAASRAAADTALDGRLDTVEATLPGKLDTATASSTFRAREFHDRVAAFSLPQFGGGRQCAGVYKNGATERLWSFNSTTLYQVDSLTATNWAAVTLPANIATSGANAKVIVSSLSGTEKMYLVGWNTSTSRYEVYSSPLVARTVAPTWSGPLLTLAANATLIPTAVRATSTGIFVGEYTGTPNITGGPTLYRSTDGAAFSAVLGPLATTRHFHGVYEDPFNAGHIYATVGDTGSPGFIYRSTNGGSSFTSIPGVAADIWQTVALGFTSEYVWALSDQSASGGHYVFDRTALTPKWSSFQRHDRLPVPGGVSARVVTDAAITASSATLTSATAAFTSRDVGRYIYGNNSVQFGTYIAAYVNATTVTLSQNMVNTLTSQTIHIAGDMFYANAYTGATDPDTGWMYFVANDASVGGNTGGIFVQKAPGDAPVLLMPLFLATALGNFECYIAGGYLIVERYGPMPLLTAV